MPRLTTLSLKTCSLKRTFLSFSFYLLCFHTIYGETHSFSGSIGKYPIYLQLNITGSNATGYYFYKNKLIDISFVGTCKAGVVTLKVIDAFGEIPEEPEVLKFKWPVKTLVGTWTNKGKSLELKLLPLTLKEVSSPKLGNPYFVKENPEINNPNKQLTKVKIGLFKLKEDGPASMSNGIRIRYFKEVTTGISLFRVDSGLVADKQKDANLYLENFHLSEFLGSLECASYSTYGSDFSLNVSTVCISNDLLCFSVFVAYYCGGAHPEENNYGVNYDLNTHQRIESGDYLLPGKEAVFETRVFDYLSGTHPGYFSAESPEDDLGCEYYAKELWTADCDFTFTDEGIKLLPSFPHYKAPCLEPEWAVIPYSELKTIIKPEFYGKLNKLKH